MPQNSSGSDRVPTMPQNSGSNDGRIATMPQSATEGAGAGGRVATLPQDGAAQGGVVGGRLLITFDTEFTGDHGKTYQIEADHVISADSGESQIYACHPKDAPDEKCVARVLISVTPQSSPERRQTRDKVIAFLDKVSMDPESHILPLLEHGSLLINGREHYIEIYPFCEGGDLERRKGQISYRELQTKIVPALNEALHAFHEAGLVHRDVKPDNLYVYDGKVVIGDFGITCDLRRDGFATDRDKTGTLGYYAPELMSQAALRESDYYSFGQTIWTLYSGEMMYGNLIRMNREFGVEEQRNQVNSAMLHNTWYGLEEISSEDQFLEVLIRGLLQYDPSHRFGYEKVRKWLSGDKSLAREVSEDSNTLQTFSKPLKMQGKVCWDDTDVCNVLCANWDAALYALYDGVLKDFYSSQDFDHARMLDKIMKTYAKGQDGNRSMYLNEIGLTRTIMYLSKNRVLCWRGSVFKTMDDISVELHQFLRRKREDNDYYGLVYSSLIPDWYATMRGAQDDVKETLEKIRTMIKKSGPYTRVALYWLVYLLAQDRGRVQICGCYDLPAFIRFLLNQKGDMYGMTGKSAIVEDQCFLGLLCVWGYEKMANCLLEMFEEGYATRFELLFDFMEKEMESAEDKKLVDQFYYEMGPKAYLVWWKQHLKDYDYHGSESETIRKTVEKVQISPEASIKEQREGLQKLLALSEQFMAKMESNLYLASLGIESISEDYIFSNKLSCMWDYEFLGQQAPIGFKFVIEG